MLCVVSRTQPSGQSAHKDVLVELRDGAAGTSIGQAPSTQQGSNMSARSSIRRHLHLAPLDPHARGPVAAAGAAAGRAGPAQDLRGPVAAAGHVAGLSGASRQVPRDGRLVAAGDGSLPRWRVFKPPSDAAAQAAVQQRQPVTAEEAKGSVSIVKSAVLRLEAFCRQQQWEVEHQADRVVRSKSVGAQRATLASLSAEVAEAISAKQQLQHSRGSGMAVGPAMLPSLSGVHLQHGRSPGLAVGMATLPRLSDSEAALRRPSRRLSARLRPGSAPANTPRHAADALESGSNSSSTESGVSAAAVVHTQDAVPGSGNSSEAEQVGQAPAATGRPQVPLLHLEEVTPELLATSEPQPKQEPVTDAWAEPLAPSTPQRETPQPPANKGPAHVQGVYLHIKALQQGSRMLLDGEEASARHVQVRQACAGVGHICPQHVCVSNSF